ncbi:MAG TPA: DHA2 family efflux MFS transporter permease subunit [Pseudonocardia sp.]
MDAPAIPAEPVDAVATGDDGGDVLIALRPAATRPIPPVVRTPHSAAPAPAPVAPVVPVHWLVPVVVVVVGMFLSVLDSSILGVALPVIGKDFYVNNEDLNWVNTSFRVSEAVVVPATAWLAARWGLRRMYLIALVLFAAFSLLTSLAWSFESLVGLRVLQAIPGSMTPVVSLAIIFKMVPAAKRGLALSLYGLGIISAPGLAPLIGGLLVEHGAWRTVFYVDAPLALLGLLAAWRVLPAMPGSPARRFDPLGFLSIAFGLSALVVAITQGPQWGWSSYPVLMLGTFGTLALALFVVIELEVEHPLIELRMLTHRPYLALIILIDIMFTGVFAVLLYLPQFLAQAQGLSPTDTGLLLLPQALLWMAMMPLAGLLYARVGARWPAAIGLTLTAVGTLALATITVDTPRPELQGWLYLRAFGLGLTVVPILASGMTSLPPALVNDGSALRTLAQRITASLGLSLLTAMQLHQQAQLFSDHSALMRPGTNPLFTELAAKGHTTLIGLWQQVTVQAATQAYANVFLIAGALTLLGAILAAVLLPTGNPAHAQGSG